MFRYSSEIIRVPMKKSTNHSKTTDDNYKCDMCDEGGWTSETEAALHGKIYHGEKIYALVKKSSPRTKPLCLICLAWQPDVATLISHWKTAHLLSSPTAKRVEREIFVCDYCRQLFFNKLLLQMHIVQRHNIKVTKVECPVCFRNIKLLCVCAHLHSHRALRLSSCRVCLHKFENTSSLQKHMENVHKKHLFCDVCGFVTTRVDIFHAHVTKYEEANSTVSSTGCPKDYKKYFLRSHHKNAWKNHLSMYGVRGLVLYNNINICTVCRQICVNKKEMREHILQAHRTYHHNIDTPKKMHKCACGESFDSKVLYKQHMFKMNHGDYLATKDVNSVLNTESSKESPQELGGIKPDPIEERCQNVSASVVYVDEGSLTATIENQTEPREEFNSVLIAEPEANEESSQRLSEIENPGPTQEVSQNKYGSSVVMDVDSISALFEGRSLVSGYVNTVDLTSL